MTKDNASQPDKTKDTASPTRLKTLQDLQDQIHCKPYKTKDTASPTRPKTLQALHD